MCLKVVNTQIPYLFWFVVETCGNFDFEKGTLEGWRTQEKAFNYQPTLGDNILARTTGSSKTSSGHQGKWWIGTYENRSSAEIPAGNTQGDLPRGAITSSLIRITGPNANFLIGGSCSAMTRVYLLVDSTLVRFFSTVTIECKEQMTRVSSSAFDAYIGMAARIIVFDFNGAEHINFDDFRGDFVCLGKIVPVPFLEAIPLFAFAIGKNIMQHFSRCPPLTNFLPVLPRFLPDFSPFSSRFSRLWLWLLEKCQLAKLINC